MFKQSISVVFPAFNEQENIKKTLRSSIAFLSKNFKSFEVIVVDDGSKDKTKDIVLDYRKQDRHVRLVEHKKNIGYGAAVWDGIKAAKKELVFFADSDGQFDIKELKVFVQKIDSYDAVLGYRRKRNDRFMRKLNALGWKVVCFLLLGVKVKDIDCAFKLFKRESVQKVKVKSIGATFSAELLYKLQKNNNKMLQLPVNHFARKAGRATGAKMSVILKAFDEIWKLYSTDSDLVNSRTRIVLWASALILFLSRFLFLSRSADFFDSNQYFWRAKTPEILKAMATGHSPYHPLYNFFNVIFYKIGFHDVSIATSITSALFGSLSVIFLFLSLKKLFGSKLSYLVSFLYAISPFVWISQITTLVDATQHCFYFLAFYFLLLAFEGKRSRQYLYSALSGLSIGLAAFAHTQVGMWVLPLALIPVIKNWQTSRDFIFSLLKKIVLFVVCASIFIVGYLYLMHISPNFQPDVSKPASWLENLKYLVLGNVFDKQPISIVNLYKYLRAMLGSLVLIIGFIGFIEMAIKKPKNMLILLIWAVPLIFSSTYIYENLYGRALIIGLVPILVFACYFILSRRGWVRGSLMLIAIGQLLLLSYPNVLKYKTLPALNEELAKQQTEVAQKGVFVASNVNKTWASYDGDFVGIGDVGYGAAYAKEKIASALSSGRPAYLSSAAVKWPYRRFDGMNYDIRSNSLNSDTDRGTILNEIFDNYSVDLDKNRATSQDLSLYKISNNSEIDLNSIKSLGSNKPIIFGKLKDGQNLKNVAVNVYSNSICMSDPQDISAYDLVYCIKNYLTREKSLDNWTFSDRRGFFSLPVSKEFKTIKLGYMPTTTNNGEAVSQFIKKQSIPISGQSIGDFKDIESLRQALSQVNSSYYVVAEQNSYKLYKFDVNLEKTNRLEAEDLAGQIGEVTVLSGASGGEVRSNRISDKSAYLISGPYIKLKAGRYTLDASVRSIGSKSGEIIFDATGDYGRINLADSKKSEKELKKTFHKISLELNLEKDVEQAEFRIFVPSGSQLEVDYLELNPR